MAMLDYGALLKINGKLVNKNSESLFMDMEKDLGFVVEKAIDVKSGESIQINGNYFVYAGDEDFLLCVYKGLIKFISNSRVIHTYFGGEITGETLYFDELSKVSVSYLDKNKYICKEELDYELEEYLSKRKWLRYVKLMTKNRKDVKLAERGYRFIATWGYKGNKYECIFGYGIDNDEKTWNRIKNTSYGFSPFEKEIIDKWFRTEGVLG